MKKTYLCAALFGAILLAWCGSSNTDVIKYNDSFVEIVKTCTDSTQELFQKFSADGSTVDTISESIENSITVCQNAKDQASELWNFEKDSSLKDAVIELMDTEVEYLNKFSETSVYWNIDNITEEDKTNYEALVTELYNIQDNLNLQFVTLQEAQELFAAKHWLVLE